MPTWHMLVVGGTGMLAGVCLALAERGAEVSVIARDRQRLEALAERAAEAAGAIHPVPVDYTDEEALAVALGQARAERGPIALAVAWVHSTAPEAPERVADLRARPARPRARVSLGRPEPGRRAAAGAPASALRIWSIRRSCWGSCARRGALAG